MPKSGLTFSSTDSAIVINVFRLYPGGGNITPNIRFLFPSGKYSNFGTNKYAILIVVNIIHPMSVNEYFFRF